MPDKGVRNTLMFSATFEEEVQRLAQTFLNNHLFLTVGIVGAANTDVTQTFFKVEKHEKRDKVESILKEHGDVPDKTLVFVETKRNADFLAVYLSGSGLPTTSIHGDRLQRQREEALADFKSGRMKVLVATAVAARGLDIRGVEVVINYDMPDNIDDYVHRIGRTGRVGNLGRALSFFDTSNDSPIAGPLVTILSQAQQEVPDWLDECARTATDSSGGYGGGFGSRDVRRGAQATTTASGGFDEEEAW